MGSSYLRARCTSNLKYTLLVVHSWLKGANTYTKVALSLFFQNLCSDLKSVHTSKSYSRFSEVGAVRSTFKVARGSSSSHLEFSNSELTIQTIHILNQHDKLSWMRYISSFNSRKKNSPSVRWSNLRGRCTSNLKYTLLVVHSWLLNANTYTKVALSLFFQNLCSDLKSVHTAKSYSRFSEVTSKKQSTLGSDLTKVAAIFVSLIQFLQITYQKIEQTRGYHLITWAHFNSHENIFFKRCLVRGRVGFQLP